MNMIKKINQKILINILFHSLLVKNKKNLINYLQKKNNLQIKN
jgi:hypothetical protein